MKGRKVIHEEEYEEVKDLSNSLAVFCSIATVNLVFVQGACVGSCVKRNLGVMGNHHSIWTYLWSRSRRTPRSEGVEEEHDSNRHNMCDPRDMVYVNNRNWSNP